MVSNLFPGCQTSSKIQDAHARRCSFLRLFDIRLPTFLPSSDTNPLSKERRHCPGRVPLVWTLGGSLIIALSFWSGGEVKGSDFA